MTGSESPPTDQAHKLPIIGRERALIDTLAKALHNTARSLGDYTSLREIPRGEWFEVALADGRIARVTIELDRVVRDAPSG